MLNNYFWFYSCRSKLMFCLKHLHWQKACGSTYASSECDASPLQVTSKNFINIPWWLSSTHCSFLGSRRALWKSCFLPKNPNTMTQSRLQPRPHDLKSDSFGDWSCSQTVYLWLYPKDQDITGWLKNKPVVGDKSGKCNLCQLYDTPSQTIVKLLLLQLFFFT